MTDKENSRSYTAFMTSSGFAGFRYWDDEKQQKTPEITAESENSTVIGATDTIVIEREFA